MVFKSIFLAKVMSALLLSMPAWAFGSQMAMDASGHLHLAYRGDSGLQYITNASGSWVTEPVSDDLGTFFSIAVDSLGKVHMAYREDSDSTVQYATNASGSWVPTTIAVGYHPSLAVDSVDKVHISYGSAGALLYASNASGSWIAEEVDPGTDVGGYTSIALDSSDRAHISYFRSYLDLYGEWTRYDLKYATNASGVWSRTSIGYVGQVYMTEYYRGDTSIAVDGAGKAHIATQGDGYLRYATNASGAWLLTSLDSIGYLVGKPSIAVDILDGVHISYSTGLEGLKYITNASGAWAITEIGPCSYASFTSLALNGSGRVDISYEYNMLPWLATYESGMWATAVIPYPCTDEDGDGFGFPGNPACPYPGGDCDDHNPDVNPDASEGPDDLSCSDGLDNDCNGYRDGDDPGCASACIDHDGDGYGSPARPTCPHPELDCDDYNADVNPGAEEGPFGDPTCSDYDDNDCDGAHDGADSGCAPVHTAATVTDPSDPEASRIANYVAFYLLLPLLGLRVLRTLWRQGDLKKGRAAAGL